MWTEGWTERRANRTKLTVTFRNFAKSPNNTAYSYLLHFPPNRLPKLCRNVNTQKNLNASPKDKFKKIRKLAQDLVRLELFICFCLSYSWLLAMLSECFH